MPLFAVHEERVYYVRANNKSHAEVVYGNAHPTDAANAEVTKVQRIKREDIGNADVLTDDYS